MPDRLTDLIKGQARKRLPGDARREVRWWADARRGALARRTRLVAGWTVLWRPGGACELVPIEVPEAGPGEVTIEPCFTAVSAGTERAQYLRLPNAQVGLPYRPGYSAAGVARAVGPEVEHVRPGDRIAAIGVAHASVATVPAASVFAVPDGVSLEDAATIRLGIIGALGPRLGRLVPGEAVCILGAGMVGLLSQRLATAAGAGLACVVATSRAKEAAVQAGAAVIIEAADAEGVAGLGAPLVIEATADPAALDTAIAAAAPSGRIVLLGSSRGRPRALPVAALRAKNLTLVGAHVTTLRREAELTGVDAEPEIGADYLTALAAGRVSVADLITRRVDPREAGIFYRELAHSRDIVGALFDWTCLGAERTAAAPMLRRPDIGPHGTHEGEPAPPANGLLPVRTTPRMTSADPFRRLQPNGASATAGEDRDPFAGATGYLRVGLLGAGDIAVKNAAGLAAAPNTELTACFDPVSDLAEDVARLHGGEVVASIDALLDRADVDAVFVCVPHHLHAPLALRAIEAGKHVIVEKPPANDLASTVAMAAAARRAGVALSVCFPHRYDPNVRVARRLIADGALGEFGGALVHFLSDKPASYWLGGFSGRATSDWRSSRERAGGGVLIMNLSHHIDLVRHLVGVEAESLLAEAAAVDEAVEVEDTVSVSVRYANGALGTVFGCSAARGMAGATELRVWGRDGNISVESSPGVYTLRAVDGVRASRWQTFGALAPARIRAIYVSRLATALDQGCDPDVTVADSLAVQAFIEAAYRSAERGERVRPADVLREAGA